MANVVVATIGTDVPTCRQESITHPRHPRASFKRFCADLSRKIHIVIRIIPANINSLLFSFPFFSYPRRWIEEEEEEEIFKRNMQDENCKHLQLT